MSLTSAVLGLFLLTAGLGCNSGRLTLQSCLLGDNASCPEGLVCRATASTPEGAGVCVPGVMEEQREKLEGDTCTPGEACAEGLVCWEMGEGRGLCLPKDTCTLPGGDECGDAHMCMEAMGMPAGLGKCVPNTCTDSGQCPNGWSCEVSTCVPPSCDNNKQCPTGWSCLGNLCVPDSCRPGNNQDCPSTMVCNTSGNCVMCDTLNNNGCELGEKCHATPNGMGVCLPTQPSCTPGNHNECNTLLNELCLADANNVGHCVPAGSCTVGAVPSECTGSEECLDDPSLPSGLGTCQPADCRTTGCNAGWLCDASTGTCMPTQPNCTPGGNPDGCNADLNEVCIADSYGVGHCALAIGCTLSDTSLSNITYGSADLTVTCDKDAVAYWIALPAHAPVPTADQIVAEAGANTGAMTANTPFFGALSGLSSETDYSLYFVALSNGAFSAVWLEAFTTLTRPIEDVPIGVDGRTLTPSHTGDTVNWIEIARNGNYSLIVRAEFINIQPYKMVGSTLIWGDPQRQMSSFGSTAQYMTAQNSIRMKINAWFNGTAQGEAEKLPADARLREFTVQTNVSQPIAIGTSTTLLSLSSGFTKPSNVFVGTGNEVAFALSYSEAAHFVSLSHFLRGEISNWPSSAIAKANFAKINLPAIAKPTPSTPYTGMWLRSPGDLANTAAFISTDVNGSPHGHGRVFQEYISDSRGLLYPAVWVDEGIFSL